MVTTIMEHVDPPELGFALMRWVNALGLSRKISSWRDLRDGQVFWEILCSVEPDYFTEALPEPDANHSENWIPRWQNLKFVTRQVLTYICDELKELPELSKRMDPDLKAIAIDASVPPTTQLLKAILLAAMYSPVSNPQMVKVMNKLNPKDALQIAECITQMQALDERLGDADEHREVSSIDGSHTNSPRIASPLPPDHGRDPLLEREEKLITAFARIDDLEKKNGELRSEVQKYVEEISQLQDDLVETKYRMEQKGLSDADNEILDQLRQKSKTDQYYITELESELTNLKESAESQERQLDRLQADTEAKQKLRDDLQLLRVERDDLLQKTKASDNLRKKIQSLQDSDRINQTLRADYERAQEDLKSLEIFKSRCLNLQKAQEESMKLIQNGEQEIFDQKTTRRRLDHEMKVLQQKLRTADDKAQKDQTIMHEQEERIRELEAEQSKEIDDPETLDDELISRQRSQTEMKHRLAALELEVSQARAREAQGTTNEETALLLQRQEALQARAEKAEKKYLDLYQENLGLETSLKDAENSSTTNRPFVELRDRLKVETAKHEDTAKQLFGIESELTKHKLRTESAEAKLAALDQDKATALEILKASISTENGVLHTENSRLLTHIRNYQRDLDEQKSLVRHVLLDKSALLQEDSILRAKNEYKWVMEQLILLKDGDTQEEKIALTLTNRIEDARNMATGADDKAIEGKIQNYETTIFDLKNRLEASEAVAKDAITQSNAMKVPPQNLNIVRELDLMATAWYDLTSRMQSDAVVIQRRTEGPKSFLGRQRKLVNQSRPLAQGR